MIVLIDRRMTVEFSPMKSTTIGLFVVVVRSLNSVLDRRLCVPRVPFLVLVVESLGSV